MSSLWEAASTTEESSDAVEVMIRSEKDWSSLSCQTILSLLEEAMIYSEKLSDPSFQYKGTYKGREEPLGYKSRCKRIQMQIQCNSRNLPQLMQLFSQRGTKD